jgi:hypothetical protein
MTLLSARRSTKFLAVIAASLFSPLFIASAADTSIVTVEIVGKGKVTPDYDGQSLTNGVKYTMTAKPTSGFVFGNWSGDANSTKTKLTFTNSPGLSFTATFVDKQKPTLKLNPVPDNNALATNTFFIGGTAKDNDTVADVFCQVNGTGWQEASTVNGWSNWWFDLSSNPLTPGTNTVEAYAVDPAGNASATGKLKLTYVVTPSSLNGYTITAVKPDDSIVTFDFGASSFTQTEGVGTYSFKKQTSTTGKLTITFSAPPPVEKGSFVLQFTNANAGTFTDADGVNTFTMTPANGWAPPSLTGSSIVFANDDGVNQTTLGFYEPPTVIGNGSPSLPNPLVVPLESAYPGEFADRVKVEFTRSHFISQSNAWVNLINQSFIGSIIDIGDNDVTVLFDSPPKNTSVDQYRVADGTDLAILSCSYNTSANDTPIISTNATFGFTNTSPDGAILKLNSGSQTEYIVMTFTDENYDGTYYDELYSSGSTNPVVTTGSFSIALAPQITSSPQSISITNGGNAAFNVAAKGTPTLLYQWQHNGTNLADGATGWGSTIVGSATTNLVITSVATNDLGSYQAVVANSIGSVTSSSATLSFPPPPQPPQITNQPPATQTATNGDTVKIAVSVTGSAPLAFQWQYFGTNLVDGGNISGVLTSNLVFNPAFTNNTGNYQVIITNAYGAVTSTPSFLSVVPVSLVP